MAEKNHEIIEFITVPIIYLFIVPFFLNGCVWFLVGGAAEGGYVAGNKQSAGQTVRDQTITAGIKTKMIANRDVAARNINVTTEGGIVTLSGTVRSEKEREIVVKIARTTKGARRIIANLEVLPK